MGISVKCPNGHEFKVKDKYAGKKGLCPFCDGHVSVRVPDAVSSENLQRAARRVAAERHGAPSAADDSSVFDDSLSHGAGASGSLIGSSVIRHNVKCKCGEHVPMWFARCPKCGVYMPQQ